LQLHRFESSATIHCLSALLLAVSLSMAALSAHAARTAEHRNTAGQELKPSAKAQGHQGRTVRRSKKVKSRRVARRATQRPSTGQLAGLRATTDALALKSSVALVLDQDTKEVLFSKNSEAVLPIASITKLMTAMIVTESNQPLSETLRITQADVDTEKGSRSRLRVGTKLSREKMLHLALMSSENRAAHALGRNYPGGMDAFVAAMNSKAQELGMTDTRYVEPTGLSSNNQSSARDLATLVNAAHEHQIIRELSTSPEYSLSVGRRELRYRNTNGLVRDPDWDIGLQKTGYISEAGRCLVMQAQLAGRKLIMVFLDAASKYARIGDAKRVRRWVIESAPTAILPAVAVETR